MCIYVRTCILTAQLLNIPKRLVLNPQLATHTPAYIVPPACFAALATLRP